MNIKYDGKGIDNLTKRFSNLAYDGKNLGTTYQLGEMFTERFMKTYTEFSTIDEFWNASPFLTEKEEDFDNINETELDRYVGEVTSFGNWNELVEKAFELYIVKKMKL